MSLEEYRNILNEELHNGNNESDITILKAKQELLKDEDKRRENFDILSSLDGHSLSEQISILDNYINQNKDGISNEKGKSYSLSKPGIPKIFTDERDGYTNIVLLSIALIIIVIIIFGVIFV